MAPYACSSPFHEGDRLIVSRYDALERRLEWRRVTDQGRERVVLTGHVCNACMKAEVADRRGEDRTIPMFEGGAP